jgi:hypothetical protein
MKVEIHSLENRGDQNEERIWLKVNEDCNLTYYIISDTTYTSSNSISNKLRHIYWFAPKEVKAGDWVLLHTKNGTNSESNNKAGTKTHIYYWGLNRPVWNDDGDCGVLFELKTWMTKK